MTLAARLWAYQSERFPLGRSAALVAVFAASGVSLSSVLGHRPLPGVGGFAVAFVVAFLLFFQLRAADEVKDAEDDRRFRPERPVPRGLVSLRLIVGLGVAGAAVQAVAALLYAPALLGLLVVVWGWLGLMSVEFFAPSFLRARPVLYLVSHMAIMPLIDLWITAADWLPRGGVPPAGLAPALLLSFANGCVLEIGRKVWAVERPGVETYSALWGLPAAINVWLAALGVAWLLLATTGAIAGGFFVVMTGGAGAAGVCGQAALAFRTNPTDPAQRRFEALAGGWVLISYALLGLVPALSR